MRYLSIGELAERTGVPSDTLRAWERRYGLVRPQRTPGGHRRYDEHDVARVVHARRLTEQGLPISVAARRVTEPAEPQRLTDVPGPLRRLRQAVRQATERLDADGIHAPLRRARDQVGLARTLDVLAVPLLWELGDHWRGSPRKIAREHLTSTMLRSFLIEEIRGAAGRGPVCIAACPDREQHELGAIMAAAAMAETGWRPLVLGASTPWATIDTVVAEIEPTVLFIGATMITRGPLVPAGWDPPTGTLVVVGGPGVPSSLAEVLPTVRVHQDSYSRLPSAIAQWTDRA
ncbi:MAG: MerR family transcriptional regulator [Actinobacteria bacterium]|nr:MerR family transcriptional regulator [Actinomycetota bacterium]